MSIIRDYRIHPRTRSQLDFSAMGDKLNKIENGILELDKFKNTRMGSTFADEARIIDALERGDKVFLRNLSMYYMSISGIYQRLVEYMATILTYDWLAYPKMVEPDTNVETINAEMEKVLEFLDNMNIKTSFAKITRKVLIEGSYYGYLVVNPTTTNAAFLELPAEYCRSRVNVNGRPAVEFNLNYFDDTFRNEDTKQMIIDSFPKEFGASYKQKENGNLEPDPDDRGHWFLCDTNFATKFSVTSNDIPFFVAVIPTILNLDEAKQLDLKKTTQELLKILIQKMPLDKNGELIFDIEESQDMHNTASRMLSGAVNIDLLTTFAEVEAIDLDSSTATSIRDPLAKVERGIFNEAGVSQNLFATDGNLALEKSILNDEAILFRLLDDYESMLNNVLSFLFDGTVNIRISLPHLSVFNQDRKQKMYKDMATNGYSKLMPAISSGMSQTEFLSLNHYEETVLDLGEKLVPVQSSNTMSSKDGKGDGKVGAPEKDIEELSEKTIQNKESQS